MFLECWGVVSTSVIGRSWIHKWSKLSFNKLSHHVCNLYLLIQRNPLLLLSRKETAPRLGLLVFMHLQCLNNEK